MINWIELTDQERLCRYAEEARRADACPHFSKSGNEESYFVDTAARQGGHIPDLLRYEPASIRGILDKLKWLWEETDLPERDLLIKICCSAIMKNDPYPLDYARRLHEWKFVTGQGSRFTHAVTGGATQQTGAVGRAEKSGGSGKPKDPDGPAGPGQASGTGDKEEDTLTSVLVYEF